MLVQHTHTILWKHYFAKNDASMAGGCHKVEQVCTKYFLT